MRLAVYSCPQILAVQQYRAALYSVSVSKNSLISQPSVYNSNERFTAVCRAINPAHTATLTEPYGLTNAVQTILLLAIVPLATWLV